MTTTYLTANQLRERFRAPDVTTVTPDGDFYLDVDLAIAAYVKDPYRFHKTTDDNPDGDPVVALILEDGPWWVPQDDPS